MSIQTPTTADLNAAIIAQLESEFGQTVPVWKKAFIRVLSKVLAGFLVLLYKYGSSMFLQMFVSYATSETVEVSGKKLIPLVEWGRLVGLGDPTEATRAEYDINLTCTVGGGTLPKDTQFKTGGNDFIYLTTAAVALTVGTVSAHIKAYSDPDGEGGKGTGGNFANPIGTTVSLVTPRADVETDAVTTAQTVTAADAEAWSAYRQRVIDRFRKQPQGGAMIDYEGWAEEVEGIINAYVYTGNPGVVEVWCEATVASSGDPDGIPTVPQIQAVRDAIDYDDSGLASRRPISSYVYVYGINRSAFDITISGLQVDAQLESELKTKISDALTAYFWAKEPFISGLTLGVRNDRISKAEVSGVIQDVCTAYNAIYNFLTVKKAAGVEFYIYSLGKGEKAKPGALTYV